MIKGIPAVHDDDNLIVSHIALEVSDMPALKKMLKENGVPFRINVSVPNPLNEENPIVDQVMCVGLF
mgnify:FL=1